MVPKAAWYDPDMLDIWGVPFDRCGKRPGSAMGPAALRFAGLTHVLHELGHSVTDRGDIAFAAETAQPGGLTAFGEALPCYAALQASVGSSLRAGNTPLVIGGDHSLSIGSVNAAAQRYGSELAVLWIDAHADLNSPGTSPTGNLHGMPIGFLAGYPSEATGIRHEQWEAISNRLGSPTLKPDQFAWIGLRDVDQGEAARIARTHSAFASTMADVDRVGIQRVLLGFHEWMHRGGFRYLWVSFDVDVMDPNLAPGTGTTVRGGLTYREAHTVAESLGEWLHAPDAAYKLAGMDLVEVNPLIDIHNETARVAVEWLGSLFGKRILGGRPNLGF